MTRKKGGTKKGDREAKNDGPRTESEPPVQPAPRASDGARTDSGSDISVDLIKKLRERTGCGVMESKSALREASGDLERAIDILRAKGAAKAEKKASRATAEGRVGSYIHGEGKIGVMVEVACETDFVARNQQFKDLIEDICMQVCATDPIAVGPDEVNAEVIEREMAIYRQQVADKPEKIREKIVEGKLSKFLEEKCLLKQAFVKDDSKTIEQLVHEAIGSIGENIRIKRFVRFAVGEEE